MSKNHFLKKNKFDKSYRFLANYHKFNSKLRGVILRILFDAYEKHEQNNKLNEDLKRIILSKIELEILSKIMEQIEDLAALTYAFNEPLERFIENFIKFSSVQKQLDLMTNASQSKYWNILTYPEISALKISKKEKELLRKVCKKINAKELNKVIFFSSANFIGL